MDFEVGICLEIKIFLYEPMGAALTDSDSGGGFPRGGPVAGTPTKELSAVSGFSLVYSLVLASVLIAPSRAHAVGQRLFTYREGGISGGALRAHIITLNRPDSTGQAGADAGDNGVNGACGETLPSGNHRHAGYSIRAFKLLITT